MSLGSHADTQSGESGPPAAPQCIPERGLGHHHHHHHFQHSLSAGPGTQAWALACGHFHRRAIMRSFCKQPFVSTEAATVCGLHGMMTIAEHITVSWCFTTRSQLAGMKTEGLIWLCIFGLLTSAPRAAKICGKICVCVCVCQRIPQGQKMPLHVIYM